MMKFLFLSLSTIVFTFFEVHPAFSSERYDAFIQKKRTYDAVNKNLWGVIVPSMSQMREDGTRPVIAIWNVSVEIPWYESEVDMMSCMAAKHSFIPDPRERNIEKLREKHFWEIKECKVISNGPRYQLAQLAAIFSKTNHDYHKRKKALLKVIDDRIRKNKISIGVDLAGMLLPVALPAETGFLVSVAALGITTVGVATGIGPLIAVGEAAFSGGYVLVSAMSFAKYVYDLEVKKPELEGIRERIIANIDKVDSEIPTTRPEAFFNQYVVAEYPTLGVIEDLEARIAPFGNQRTP